MAKRTNGEGTIYKSGDKWIAQYSFEGKRHSIYGKTQNEVKEKLKLKTTELELVQSKGFTDYLNKSRTLFSDWIDEWLEDYAKPPKIRISTYTGYEVYARLHIKPVLGKYEMCELHPKLFQDFFNAKERKYSNEDGDGLLSPKSLYNMHYMLSKALKQAISNGLLLHNPLEGVTTPPLEDPEMRVLTIHEQKRLVNIAKTHSNPVMFSVILALYTGLRKGEILGLQWQDIDFQKQELNVRRSLARHIDLYGEADTKSLLVTGKPKTKNAVRTICLFDSLCNDLLNYQEKLLAKKKAAGIIHKEADFVFVSRNFKCFEPRNYYRSYQLLLDKAEIEDAGFHTLRHTFATRSLEAGMDIYALSKILGHAKPTITLSRYAHLLPEHKRDSMNKLSGMYDVSA